MTLRNLWEHPATNGSRKADEECMHIPRRTVPRRERRGTRKAKPVEPLLRDISEQFALAGNKRLIASVGKTCKKDVKNDHRGQRKNKQEE